MERGAGDAASVVGQRCRCASPITAANDATRAGDEVRAIGAIDICIRARPFVEHPFVDAAAEIRVAEFAVAFGRVSSDQQNVRYGAGTHGSSGAAIVGRVCRIRYRGSPGIHALLIAARSSVIPLRFRGQITVVPSAKGEHEVPIQAIHGPVFIGSRG